MKREPLDRCLAAALDERCIDATIRTVARPCAIYATDVEPRGWATLSLGANTMKAFRRSIR